MLKSFAPLDPYWVTGFTDAEGCFQIKYSESSQYRLKWRVQAVFQIKLHERDLPLLNRIKNFFRVGTLTRAGTEVVYSVKSIKDLAEFIIAHFDSFPLLTKNSADFELFKQIVLIMANKGHLNSDSFEKILSLRANLNLGMSEKLKLAFPDIIPIARPEISLKPIANPQWLTGFIDGKGCFHINVQKHLYKINSDRTDKIWLTFQITQHSRDRLFMESLIKYLDAGRVRDRNYTPTLDFLVNNYNDINSALRQNYPFF